MNLALRKKNCSKVCTGTKRRQHPHHASDPLKRLAAGGRDQIHLTTTDLMSACAAVAKRTWIKTGATTLPARRLSTSFENCLRAKFRSMSMEKMRFDPQRPKFLQNSRLPEDEFPPLPKFEDAKSGHDSAERFARWPAQDFLCHIDR